MSNRYLVLAFCFLSSLQIFSSRERELTRSELESNLSNLETEYEINRNNFRHALSKALEENQLFSSQEIRDFEKNLESLDVSLSTCYKALRQKPQRGLYAFSFDNLSPWFSKFSQINKAFETLAAHGKCFFYHEFKELKEDICAFDISAQAGSSPNEVKFNLYEHFIKFIDLHIHSLEEIVSKKSSLDLLIDTLDETKLQDLLSFFEKIINYLKNLKDLVFTAEMSRKEYDEFGLNSYKAEKLRILLKHSLNLVNNAQSVTEEKILSERKKELEDLDSKIYQTAKQVHEEARLHLIEKNRADEEARLHLIEKNRADEEARLHLIEKNRHEKISKDLELTRKKSSEADMRALKFKQEAEYLNKALEQEQKNLESEAKRDKYKKLGLFCFVTGGCSLAYASNSPAINAAATTCLSSVPALITAGIVAVSACVWRKNSEIKKGSDAEKENPPQESNLNKSEVDS